MKRVFRGVVVRVWVIGFEMAWRYVVVERR